MTCCTWRRWPPRSPSTPCRIRPDADQVIAAFAQAGIDTAALAAELQRQGAEAFAASWQDLLARIGARHEQLARTS